MQKPLSQYEQQGIKHRKNEPKCIHTRYRFGNRTGASKADCRSQCANAVPLLESGLLTNIHNYIADYQCKI